MASLFILKGVNPGQRFHLDKEVVVVGRSPDCDLMLPSTSVSRQHARLLRVQGKWHIEDMHSRNGTFVNSQAITARTPLKHNDRVRICDFLAAFHEGAQSTMPPEMTGSHEEPSGSSTAQETSSSSHSSKVLANQPAENLKVILEISNNLVKTLEEDQLLPQIVDRLLQLFKQADRCFLVLAEEQGRLDVRVVRTRQPQEAGGAAFNPGVVRHCLETAQALLTEDDQPLPQAGATEADPQPGSIMCVPLCTADGKAFGTIQLDARNRPRKFTPDDLNLLWGVANQAAVALQNARLHEELLEREQLERDLEVAGQMQRSMLPDQVPEVGGYEFFAHYAAALMVGGDYYDFIPLSRQRLAVTLADVAGKGVSAALLMAKLSSEMRTVLLAEAEPAAAVARLNDVLYPHTQRTHRFVTLAAAVLDPASHGVTLVNAGHVPPLLYRRAAGSFHEVVPRAATGAVLGVDRGLTYEPWQVGLEPGDCLLLFTDGLVEALSTRDRRRLMDGVYQALEGPGPCGPCSLGERLLKAVEQHAARRSQHDDITLVCFGRQG